MTTTTMKPATYNPCLSAHPCLNGGTCLPKGNQGEFTCMCSQGYTGVNCQSLSNQTILDNIFKLNYI